MNDVKVMQETGVTLEQAGLRWLPPLLDAAACSSLLQQLLQDIQWHADHYTAFGRRFDIPRLQAWFAEPGIQYRYSNNFLPRQEWAPVLWDLKQDIEALCERRFNSVLATYYRDGMDSVDWHADDESELGGKPWIASFSLGAERDFRFRHKLYGTEGQLRLRSGDLLLMAPNFQRDWEHCVPSHPLVQEPRINLTFRQVVTSNAL